MFQKIHVLQNVKGFVTNSNTKKMRLNARILNDNTMVLANNDVTGAVFTSQSQSQEFESNGWLFLYSFLKPVFDADTGRCLVGQNTSLDSLESNYSASLTITFSDSPMVGSSAPASHPPVVGGFCWTEYIVNTDYYIDLKDMAKGKRYCRIQVDRASSDPDTALIEGNVFIHLATTEAKNNSNAPVYCIYSHSPVVDQGSKVSDVENIDVFFDLNSEQGLFLIPMIGLNKLSATQYRYTVGDPKDDAEIDAEEV